MNIARHIKSDTFPPAHMLPKKLKCVLPILLIQDNPFQACLLRDRRDYLLQQQVFGSSSFQITKLEQKKSSEFFF